MTAKTVKANNVPVMIPGAAMQTLIWQRDRRPGPQEFVTGYYWLRHPRTGAVWIEHLASLGGFETSCPAGYHFCLIPLPQDTNQDGKSLRPFDGFDPTVYQERVTNRHRWPKDDD